MLVRVVTNNGINSQSHLRTAEIVKRSICYVRVKEPKKFFFLVWLMMNFWRENKSMKKRTQVRRRIEWKYVNNFYFMTQKYKTVPNIDGAQPIVRLYHVKNSTKNFFFNNKTPLSTAHSNLKLWVGERGKSCIIIVSHMCVHSNHIIIILHWQLSNDSTMASSRRAPLLRLHESMKTSMTLPSNDVKRAMMKLRKMKHSESSTRRECEEERKCVLCEHWTFNFTWWSTWCVNCFWLSLISTSHISMFHVIIVAAFSLV